MPPDLSLLIIPTSSSSYPFAVRGQLATLSAISTSSWSPGQFARGARLISAFSSLGMPPDPLYWMLSIAQNHLIQIIKLSQLDTPWVVHWLPLRPLI